MKGHIVDSMCIDLCNKYLYFQTHCKFSKNLPCNIIKFALRKYIISTQKKIKNIFYILNINCLKASSCGGILHPSRNMLSNDGFGNNKMMVPK